MARRELAWQRLARDLSKDKLHAMARVEPMSKLPALAEEILQGRVQGRIVIDVNA
jgi:acrylyl-CoA reductase (NADPH)